MSRWILLLPVAAFGCHGGRAADPGGNGKSCRIEPAMLRANSIVHVASVRTERLAFPARGGEPAHVDENAEEREETNTLIDVDGATIRRMLVEITKHRVRDAEGKMVRGPLDGVRAELVADGGTVSVHPVAGALTDAQKDELVSSHHGVGKANLFLAAGPSAPAIGAPSSVYQEVITKYLHRERDEMRITLTKCEPESATFTTHLRIKTQQGGWDVDGHEDGAVILARNDGRPTKLSMRIKVTGTAPGVEGKLEGLTEQTATWRFE